MTGGRDEHKWRTLEKDAPLAEQANGNETWSGDAAADAEAIAQRALEAP